MSQSCLPVFPDGATYLEVHRDVYRKAGGAAMTVRNLAQHSGAADQLEWEEVRRVIQKRAGIAIRLSGGGP